MTDFPNLLRLLVEYGVEFIIIGGAAAVIHGSSRLTQDLVPLRGSQKSKVKSQNY